MKKKRKSFNEMLKEPVTKSSSLEQLKKKNKGNCNKEPLKLKIVRFQPRPISMSVSLFLPPFYFLCFFLSQAFMMNSIFFLTVQRRRS